MIVLAFISFFVGVTSLVFSFYLAIKLYLSIDPKKEKYIRYVPFLLFLKSSYSAEGRELLLKFYGVLFVAILLLSFAAFSGVFN